MPATRRRRIGPELSVESLWTPLHGTGYTEIDVESHRLTTTLASLADTADDDKNRAGHWSEPASPG